MKNGHIAAVFRIKNGKALFFGALSLLAFILVFISSDIAIEYMKKGLDLCALTVIPSLFPFMVISELIVQSGIGMGISHILSKPVYRIFGVSEGGACAYLLGTVCGFPIGAKTAASLYDQGDLTKDELTRILTFCNNPGSAFIINAVGVSILGSRRLGSLIYFCVIVSSLIVGFVGKLFFNNHEKTEIALRVKRSSVNTQQRDITEVFTSSIRSSAFAMLTVCAYVVFFSALVGCIGGILSHFGLPIITQTLIFGFFELSGGVGSAADVNNWLHSSVLCALFAGWSGLSVHCQIMSICSGRGISFKPYFIAKATQGIICASLVAVTLKFVLPLMNMGIEDVFVGEGYISSFNGGTVLCMEYFAASIFPLLIVLFTSQNGFFKKGKKAQKNSKKT